VFNFEDMKPILLWQRIFPFGVLVFGILSGHSCQIKKVSYAGGENLKVISTAKYDTLTANLIKPWRDSVAKSMKDTIAYADSAFLPGMPEGNLNHLVADLVKEEADRFLRDTFGYPTHLCLLNRGFLRNPLPKGYITERDLFEMMPFDNYLVFVKVGGATMDSILNEIRIAGGAVIAGLKMEIRKNEYFNAEIGGFKFDSRREYWIATSDYLLNYGDGFFSLKSAMIKVYTTKNIRDITREGMKAETKQYGKLLYHNDKRITLRKND